MTESEKLATEHWDWLSSVLKKIYIDAFVHGFKHGKKDSEKQ